MKRNVLRTTLDLMNDPVLLLAKRGDTFYCRFANTAARNSFFDFEPAGRIRRGIPLQTSIPRETIRSAIERVATGTLQDSRSTESVTGFTLQGTLLPGRVVALVARATSSPENAKSADQPDYRDATTGLMNRQALRLIAEKEIAGATRSSEPMACLFLMLHNFKEINQHHGHHVGDLVLENTGIRVREVIRRSDYVFRWEGTNLVVLLSRLATPLDVAIVAEKLFEAVTLPYRYRDTDLAPGCHIGVALFPEDATDYDELVNRANSAVIEAERRRLPFVLYDSVLHDRAVERVTIRSGIQRAFERGEFEVYFQPILHLDGSIAGAEALMRWNHAERGLLSPDSFIEIAEESHLITLIDKVAIFSVCRTLADWAQYPGFFISLNISARDLADATLRQVIQQAMDDFGLTDPGRIKLELTESRLIERATVSYTTVADLQAIGIETWIDDFGTGQSSLTYLKHLPVTTVKVDREFIQDITNDPADLDYFHSIVNTVRSRGKDIVVEGITTKEQYDLATTMPVRYLQGFYFAQPMRAEEFEKLLKSASLLPLS
ncbi:MAG: bifunctional diguanylate cyclase/phosphodiesterase [Spirochaetaceae bacterium]|nr:MAG: bifunctional diguanylate cyclase/phosphodiesterase [Spirochaetaceae bacterium]